MVLIKANSGEQGKPSLVLGIFESHQVNSNGMLILS